MSHGEDEQLSVQGMQGVFPDFLIQICLKFEWENFDDFEVGNLSLVEVENERNL